MKNKKRVADQEIYFDSKYHDEPKEYFKFILSKIDSLFPKNNKLKLNQIIDLGGANGALLSFLKRSHPKTLMTCYEPLNSLIELGKKLDPSIKFDNYSLYDIPNLQEENKADIVISAGVIEFLKIQKSFYFIL